MDSKKLGLKLDYSILSSSIAMEGSYAAFGFFLASLRALYLSEFIDDLEADSFSFG
jgi:hypothetical protein